MVTTRFVILHHRERSGEHWDLLIEEAEALASWRLTRLPSPVDRAAIPAQRLADHRKLYLTYEGPIAQDRGEVTRVDAGACDILQRGEAEWVVRFAGARLAGPHRLTRIESAGGASLSAAWLLVSAASV